MVSGRKVLMLMETTTFRKLNVGDMMKYTSGKVTSKYPKKEMKKYKHHSLYIIYYFRKRLFTVERPNPKNIPIKRFLYAVL
jgi:hypothetical protein